MTQPRLPTPQPLNGLTEEEQKALNRLLKDLAEARKYKRAVWSFRKHISLICQALQRRAVSPLAHDQEIERKVLERAIQITCGLPDCACCTALHCLANNVRQNPIVYEPTKQPETGRTTIRPHLEV